ncbi:hypothetical protein BDZ45DRAFT_691989 [Acephala macrosclerotiorum]|nr:hypothetical protein BDZ45DRAFT_691989 [Acephala macrosclerotiorum]
MENIHNNYKYKALRPEKNEIRLLELFPATRSSKISARLFSHSLDNPSIYDALSYTWGDPGVTKAIELDGDAGFHIFASLEKTLHDIRRHDDSIIIWIDAICIDQHNIAERNNQVRIMTLIYEKALMVRIWIDVDVEIPAPLRNVLETTTNLGNGLDLGDDPEFWEPVLHLFSQRYWSRVWIHQEVACAAQLSLHCRKKTVPVLGFLILGYQLAGTFTAGGAKSEWMPLYEAAASFKGKWLLELWYMRMIQARHLEDRIGQQFQSHLLNLLDKTRHLGCQNPRDRMYGLMHLAEDYEYGAIEIDYGLSVAEVYCSVPKYFVDKYERYGPTGCLVFLCAITPESLQSIHDLPSWCPDWSTERQAMVVSDMRSSPSSPPFIPAAGQVLGDKPWFSPDGKVLHAQGFRLDTVSAMCLDSMADLVKDDAPISEIFSSCLAMMSTSGEQPELLLQADINHFCLPLLRSLIAGHEFEGAEEAWTEFIELAGNPATAEMPLTEIRSLISGDGHQLLTNMSLVGEEGLLFRGDLGRVGLIPKEALFEDEVWILFDCPVPVVLRPANEFFTVVGVAYVDGFMRGESCSVMPAVVKAGDKYGQFEIATVKLE